MGRSKKYSRDYGIGFRIRVEIAIPNEITSESEEQLRRAQQRIDREIREIINAPVKKYLRHQRTHKTITQHETNLRIEKK